MAILRRRKATKEEIASGVRTDVTEAHAVLTASSSINPDSKLLAKAIERAMGAAVTKSLASGMDIVDDANGIKDAMMHERARIKEAWPHMSEAQRKQAAGET